MVAVIELVVEAVGNSNSIGGIAVLYDDEVVGLEERPPLLQEIKVPDSRDHDVELVFQISYHGHLESLMEVVGWCKWR